ncbi:Phosphate/sulfate permease [Nitrospira japonica]|uniref:Phosphate transporter n=1 Tax=Nitrospira japonica TaxID=1325564 RepID=A0A1W1I679_9BACT|nr:inorganic phosphate transporter [Nitrospira japonica]SLM48379.1 Phosphate/sulfate permease [Nitrospira japonica]
MHTATTTFPAESSASSRPILVFIATTLAAGLTYAGYELFLDLSSIRIGVELPYVLLGIALLIALGFEFVNGFHDTANAVATVIYTHSLPPQAAVLWSGFWNFLGVLFSSGAVAFGIIALLPVELILQVGTGAGFAMVFALLIAAILWNLGTWYLGLPASSSHTLIGSIIGVGLANQLMHPGSPTSGIEWGQATKIGYSLLLSPLIGFICAALLLLVMKRLANNPALFRAPQGQQPPPLWIRSLLVLTCTGVSFAHGSNDGQKGMGLIMLILIGTVPMAYALDRAVPAAHVQSFVGISQQASQIMVDHTASAQPTVEQDVRSRVTRYVQTGQLDATTLPSLQGLMNSIASQVAEYGTYGNVPDEMKGNIRNDMYLMNEALRKMDKSKTPAFSAEEVQVLKQYRHALDRATKFIPIWVKIVVAIALGLGTLVAWKRIVVTVGERIGKAHLTYAQGGAAELVAMGTIGAADVFGLPVSTTQVLSSGVAGTMAANHSGLRWTTVRNILTAWVLTLPISIALSGALYWLIRQFTA